MVFVEAVPRRVYIEKLAWKVRRVVVAKSRKVATPRYFNTSVSLGLN
jgi:hypothetical protein